MKKLMFAMAIAATVGFAQAEDPTLISKSTFDDLEVGQFSTANETDTTWTNNTDTQGPVDATVKAYDPADVDNPNYLALDGVQNLAKNINTAIGDGLYIDTMVKFTASEDAPTPGEGDKLVVWLKETPGENDNPSTYKLMVTAGYVGDTLGTITKTDYETDAVVVPDQWYNLKVKVINEVDDGIVTDDGVVGFVVLIDGEPAFTSQSVEYTDGDMFLSDNKYVDSGAIAIFPSLIAKSVDNSTTISQLAFSGSGAIDTVAAFQGDCDPDDEPTEDWVDPADEQAIAAIEGKQVAAVYPSLANTAVATVDAKKLTLWATGTGNVDFSAATGINATAFLLNIANSSTAADIKTAEDTAKEAIKITAISFDENGDVVLTYPATYGNGKIVVEGSLQLPAEWHNKVDTDKFFRTKLVLDEVAAASGE